MPPGLTSPAHLMVVVFVALVTLGPERLPGAARQAARALAELQRWSTTMEGQRREATSVDEGAAPTGESGSRS